MKHPYFLIDNKDIYNRILAEAINDELEEIYPEIKCGYILSAKDIFKADLLIMCGCGAGDYSKGLYLAISVFKKPLILYHISPDTVCFNRFAKRAKWIVTSRDIGEYDYFPSPVLISDLATPRHIERIWGRERLASKRGCIGIIGLNLDEEQRHKLVDALNFLIEDIDLNVVFIPILKEEGIKDILTGIRYSANTRLLQSDKYSSKELLGIISRLDILITSDQKGVICAMAVDRPVVGLAVNDELDQLLTGVAEEETLFDIDKISSDELYSKIKIAWVHRDTNAKQMQKKATDFKMKASEGIRRLGKEIAG